MAAGIMGSVLEMRGDDIRIAQHLASAIGAARRSRSTETGPRSHRTKLTKPIVA